MNRPDPTGLTTHATRGTMFDPTTIEEARDRGWTNCKFQEAPALSPDPAGAP